jgi:hypothetical protein
MEFQKYIDNLTNQLQLVNADIVEKQEELDKLKEFRSRIKGGMEVVKQIQTDLAEESAPLPLQQEIQQSIQELTQGRHGGDHDAL